MVKDSACGFEPGAYRFTDQPLTTHPCHYQLLGNGNCINRLHSLSATILLFVILLVLVCVEMQYFDNSYLNLQTIQARYAENETDEFLKPIIVNKEGTIKGKIFND